MRHVTLLLAALGVVTGATAQSPAPLTPPGGTESVTAADVSRRVRLIADDSLGGLGTPSPGLETIAAYIASEFRRLGLRPAGDSGSYLQRYPLEVYASRPESSAVWATGTVPARWALGQDTKFGQGTAFDERWGRNWGPQGATFENRRDAIIAAILMFDLDGTEAEKFVDSTIWHNVESD